MKHFYLYKLRLSLRLRHTKADISKLNVKYAKCYISLDRELKALSTDIKHEQQAKFNFEIFAFISCPSLLLHNGLFIESRQISQEQTALVLIY